MFNDETIKMKWDVTKPESAQLARLRNTKNYLFSAHEALSRAAIEIPGDPVEDGEGDYEACSNIDDAITAVQKAYQEVCDDIEDWREGE